MWGEKAAQEFHNYQHKLETVQSTLNRSRCLQQSILKKCAIQNQNYSKEPENSKLYKYIYMSTRAGSMLAL